jgi:hypothetical protein
VYRRQRASDDADSEDPAGSASNRTTEEVRLATMTTAAGAYWVKTQTLIPARKIAIAAPRVDRRMWLD